MWYKYFLFLRELLFPFGCSLCGDSLVDFEEAYCGLCAGCRAAVEREREASRRAPACGVCGAPLISEQERCLSCREGERAFDGVKVLFPYQGKYRKLLAAYKFAANPVLGNFFTGLVKEELSAWLTHEWTLVPVPPRPGKIRRSGWDQVEYMAALLEKAGLPVSRCLKRLASRSQKELDQAGRLTNLKGRIIAARQVPNIAVVLDDVMTTGATVEACAASLKEAGAEKVYALCLFRD